MEKLQEFDVEFARLNNGQHQYEFEITDKFFDAFPKSPIKSGNLKCNVTLDKDETLLQFDVVLEGFVNTTCDRCLNNIAYPVQTNDHLIVTLGSEFEEQDVDAIVIPNTSHKFNLGQYIYEYIYMGLPMVVNCDGLENVVCDEQTLKYITPAVQSESKEIEDPRWSGLKDLNIDKELN